MNIKLSKIMDIENLEEYKGHFAVENELGEHPLDEFVDNEKSWKRWQEFRPNGKNVFNREYIFSLIRFHPYGKSYWLFGGIWQIVERGKRYKVRLCKKGEEFIGRLVVHYPLNQRCIRVNLEKHYDNMLVHELLKVKYSGEKFPGLYNIDHDFESIRKIIQTNREGWKDVLSNTDGIYLITDIETNKRYVGAAYGNDGIWSRWESYISTGHGNNKKLKKLIENKGIAYAEENFYFSILETYRFGTSKQTIQDREVYWKEVLLTREEKFGYNDN